MRGLVFDKTYRGIFKLEVVETFPRWQLTKPSILFDT